MTVTTIPDRRTEAQRLDDEKAKLRQPLEAVIDWISDLPEFVDVTDCQRIVARHVGHDVIADDLFRAVWLLAVRNSYRGSDAEITAQQKALDAALDELLDATFCEACYGRIPDDSSRIECPVLGATFCHDECHGEAHGSTFGSRFCSALDER